MSRRVVVGAAVIVGERVLAARRRAPAPLAGRWEFPGGKVEAHESEPAALIRECAEELGIAIEIETLIDRGPIDDARELAVYLARLVRGEPEPGADHDAVRWLAARELHEVAWLDADRPFVDAVALHLRSR
ncbi:MAG TPA: NUDIX domain-containing protein [Jatrophihabitans sp.]|nr:NUDIX domain-containing protein [Jatrophihabitans sp.]